MNHSKSGITINLCDKPESTKYDPKKKVFIAKYLAEVVCEIPLEIKFEIETVKKEFSFFGLRPDPSPAPSKVPPPARQRNNR